MAASVKRVAEGVNQYGDVQWPPKGWLRIPNVRKLYARRAKTRGAAVTVLLGWGGTRNWPKPLKQWYIHPGYVPAAERSALERAARETAVASYNTR